MQSPNPRHVRILAAAAALVVGSPALAQQQDPQQEPQQERQQAPQQGSGQDMERWSRMQEQVVTAEELLDGDVSNGLNPVGTVSDLILSEDGNRVEYILYEVPYPYQVFGNEDGFTTFRGIDIERGFGLDVQLTFDRDQRPPAPEEIELTAEEADRRLVSRILGDRLYFSADESRPIEDMLINRQSGEVLSYVIESEADAVLATARRSVPAEQVSIDQEGRLNATIGLAGLDDVQEYDSDLL